MLSDEFALIQAQSSKVILERLANSEYTNNFILKGGLLISSLIGIGERTTMDMDTTVRGIREIVEDNDEYINVAIKLLTHSG